MSLDSEAQSIRSTGRTELNETQTVFIKDKTSHASSLIKKWIGSLCSIFV